MHFSDQLSHDFFFLFSQTGIFEFQNKTMSNNLIFVAPFILDSHN